MFFGDLSDRISKINFTIIINSNHVTQMYPTQQECNELYDVLSQKHLVYQEIDSLNVQQDSDAVTINTLSDISSVNALSINTENVNEFDINYEPEIGLLTENELDIKMNSNLQQCIITIKKLKELIVELDMVAEEIMNRRISNLKELHSACDASAKWEKEYEEIQTLKKNMLKFFVES